MWNPLLHSDQENLRWCLLRAIEWGNWPAFISQPVAPVMLLFWPWYWVCLGVLVANILWAAVRYRFVSPLLADAVVLPVVILKWPLGLGIGIALFFQSHYGNAAASALWPVITMGIAYLPSLILLVPPAKVGVIQKMFMGAFGYEALL